VVVDEEKAKVARARIGPGLRVEGRRKVGLIRKRTTSALVAANKANARKSTGPD
jgi:hypothetical protein